MLKKNICIISFSSRAAGNCAAIAEYIKKFYGEEADKFCFCDFSITPCGKCNYECFSHKRSCPWSDDMENILLEAVASCDLAYFIVPNYNNNPCANYFIYCERGQYYFARYHDKEKDYDKTIKRFIVVSNTEKDNFLRIFSQQLGEVPEILFLRAKDFEKRSTAGDLLSSEAAKRLIDRFLVIDPFFG